MDSHKEVTDSALDKNSYIQGETVNHLKRIIWASIHTLVLSRITKSSVVLRGLNKRIMA